MNLLKKLPRIDHPLGEAHYISSKILTQCGKYRLGFHADKKQGFFICRLID